MEEQERREVKTFIDQKPEPDSTTKQKGEGFYKRMEERVKNTPGAKGERGA